MVQWTPVAVVLLLVVAPVAGPLALAAASADSTGPAEMAGSGTEAAPYVVTNLTQLQAMEQDLDAHYVLGNDIDASASAGMAPGGFSPIGRTQYGEGAQFSGSFDGRGHVISGLVIDRPSPFYVGLFGRTKDATIENVHLAGVDVRGGTWTGSVAGEVSESELHNVSATGTVRSPDGSAGGLVGATVPATITDSSADVDVMAAGGAGGLAGFLEGKLENSYATGTVRSDGEGAIPSAGGLVGDLTRGSIANAYATGDVRGGNNVGGLVGNADDDATIRLAYATGDVRGENSVGGILGQSRTPRVGVERVYAAGEVVGREKVGGVVGNEGGTSLEMFDAYWDVTATGQRDALGDGDDTGTGLATEEMTGLTARANMDALDFENFWVATDGYPVFRWQVEGLSLAAADERVSPGGTTNLTATLRLSDGTERPASTVADYTTSNAAVSLNGTTVTGQERGRAWLTATLGEVEATTAVAVTTHEAVALAGLDAPARAAVGQPYEVTATVRNGADEAVTEPVVHRVDGQRVAVQRVDIPPGETANVTFSHTANTLTTVEHEVVLLTDAGTAATEIRRPPSLAVTTLEAPAEATVGEPVTVTATVENTGGIAGTASVELTAGGEPLATEDVSVAPNGTATVEFTVEPDATGDAEYVAAAANGSASAVVSVAEATGGPLGGDGPTGGASGFGVAAALVAVAALALARRRG